MPPRKKTATKSLGVPSTSINKETVTKTGHAPVYATLFIFAQVAPGFPYNNARFQEITGLGELGFLDPNLKVNGKPITDTEHKALKDLHDALKDNPGEILRSRPVGSIPGLKLFNTIAKAILGKTLRLRLNETLVQKKATYGHLATYNRIHATPTLPGHKTHLVGQAWYRDIFGEEGVDEAAMSEPAWLEAVSELYYRLYDGASRSFRTLEDNIGRHIAEFEAALAGESYPPTIALLRLLTPGCQPTGIIHRHRTFTRPRKYALASKPFILKTASPSIQSSSNSAKNSKST